MLVSILLLIVGFILLTRGADYFVDGASALAKKLHIPAIVIGLTVVAMGTSAPEAFISIVSALHNSNAIAIGNVIGSNIANILLILGVTSIIYTLTVQKNTLKYEMPFVAFITYEPLERCPESMTVTLSNAFAASFAVRHPLFVS